METQLKRSLMLLALLCTVATGFTQTSFHTVYTGNGYDRGEGIAQLPDSGYLVTGTSSSFDEEPAQAFLMNLDKLGNVRWSRAYGGAESEEGKRVMVVPGYGYYVAGTTMSGGTGGFDAWLMFTNESGVQQWEVTTDNGAWERIHDAILLPDTTIVAIGETDHTQEGYTDFFMIRYGKTGNVIWQKQLHYSQGDDVLYTIEPVTDTTFLVGGTLYRADSLQQKAFIGKFNRDGSLLWQNYYGNNGNYLIRDIELTSSGNIRAIGEGMKPGYSDKDVYAIYLSGTGTFYGADDGHSPDGSRYTCFVEYTAGNTGNYFLANQMEGGAFAYADGEDMVVSRYDSGLNWGGYGVNYSGTRQDQANQMINTLDGYAALTGFHTTYGAGGNSVMVIKLGSDAVFPAATSNPTVISILDTPEQEQLTGVNAWPNPFEQEVTIELTDSSFDWTLMDLSGKTISTGTGFNAQQIDCSGVASGVYLLKVTSGNHFTTFRLAK